jgi:putative spermidine/putrescine transport system permease protein
MESRVARVFIRIASLLALAFLYAPIVIVFIYAFNRSTDQSWPPALWSTRWFHVAFTDPELRSALASSLKAATGATLIALVLGGFAAFAVHRFKFFGRNTISFVLVLPIALPGIVTAIALSSAIDYGHQLFGLNFGLATIIIGHATFCVVVVYNNVVARLRRTPTSLMEASMDLGGDGWQTFRFITFPAVRTAVVAGALLAFGLSFDEIVVTNFTAGTVITLPIWIFNHIRLPRSQPVVNVVAMLVILVSIIPVYFAQRLAGGAEGVGATARAGSRDGGESGGGATAEEPSLALEAAGPG